MTSEVLLLDPLYEPTQTALENQFQCHRIWEADDRARRLAELTHIEVAASQSSAGIDADTLSALPNLKLVSNFGVGLDTYDLADCRARGVTVCNTPDVLTEEVADMALALLLATIRQIAYGDRFVRRGAWSRGGMHLTQSLQGKRVGIVGLGRIGQAIALRCKGFNTPLGYFGPRPKANVDYRYFDQIEALAQWADVLIVACPGGEATRNLVSRAALTALGEHGYIVNIARGSVIDEPALVALLEQNKLAGAGLDVFADEPQVPAALLSMDQVVLQPHQGSASVPTRTAMGQLVIDNIAAWFDGKPLLTPAN